MNRSNRSIHHSDNLVGPYRDEYRHPRTHRRGVLMFAAVAVIVLVCATIVVLIYRQGVRPPSAGLPVISSDDRPYKRVPDKRGGFEIAGQNNAFYGPMDDLGDPAMLGSTASDSGSSDLRRGEPVLTPEAPPPLADLETQPDSDAMTGSADNQQEVRSVQSSQVAQVAAGADSSRLDPQPRQEQSEAGPFVEDGGFEIQLSALRSVDAARATWMTVRNKTPDLYQGARTSIQKVDLGARGVFYRLRIGAFVDRESASTFCARVMATGQDCLVVVKSPQ